LRKLRRRYRNAGAEHRKSAIRALSFVQTKRGRRTNAGCPTLSLSRTGEVITVTFTGSLQSSTSIRGPLLNVTGAASPDAVPAPTGGCPFYRSIK
jgi:hypothetical protein